MKKIKFHGIRKLFKGRGFAAALVLSISAVGVSAYIAYNSAVDQLGNGGGTNDASSSLASEPAAAVNNPATGIGRNEHTEPATHANAPASSLPNTAASANLPGACEPNSPCNLPCVLCVDGVQAGHFVRPETPRIMPVEGSIIKPFSNGELVRSNTLGVWRTHDAVDIGAALGTEVKAMQRGTVSEVYTNPMWGVCVVIDHGDGVFSSYMSLAKDVKVTQGQEIEAGHIIGLVGNTAEAEIADPPSLHFAVRVNDEWVDPIEYIGS
ncbi:MAG: M23 family metallopeptidase [Oscillospiraceae bacterium]|nr:M23 family metallopeptidase [Oscillospiraceae bacterium]